MQIFRQERTGHKQYGPKRDWAVYDSFCPCYFDIAESWTG